MKKERAVHPSFGSMVKYLRKKKGYSLQEMEGLTGISKSYINRIENGYRECPSYPVIEKLAFGLDVEPADLLEGSMNNKNKDVVPLEQLLFSREFTLDGAKIFSASAVEALLNLIDIVYDAKWEKDSLIDDIHAISEAVDELKAELNI